jgi:hypothetical protein
MEDLRSEFDCETRPGQTGGKRAIEVLPPRLPLSWAVGESGMEITVQIAVESALGQPEVIRQVARLEHGPSLEPATLGLSLAEAGSILAGPEQTNDRRAFR